MGLNAKNFCENIFLIPIRTSVSGFRQFVKISMSKVAELAQGLDSIFKPSTLSLDNKLAQCPSVGIAPAVARAASTTKAKLSERDSLAVRCLLSLSSYVRCPPLGAIQVLFLVARRAEGALPTARLKAIAEERRAGAV